MFTGIIECLGLIENVEKEGTNVHLTLSSAISKELKVDQSVAHNGVCLTVVACNGNQHKVTAIEETIKKTVLGKWKVGDEVNLERCVRADARLDGHIVQGHVDGIAKCSAIEDREGSVNFEFTYPPQMGFTVEKGSITVNGVSLTVVKSEKGLFSVSIIPYTLENTFFKHLKVGEDVNLEFDVIGKYVQHLTQPYQK